MDPKYLPYLTDDEMTYELDCRGLQGFESTEEKRNTLELILEPARAHLYPVQPRNPADDQADCETCGVKLRELFGSIASVESNPTVSLEYLRARLEYVKTRIDKITLIQPQTSLKLMWIQIRSELNSKCSVFENRDLLTFTEIAAPSKEDLDKTFLEKLSKLNVSVAPISAPAVAPATASVVGQTLASFMLPKPPVTFIPSRHSSFFVPEVTPLPLPPLPPALSPSTAPVAFNKYVLVSRWNVTYNGTGSINAFIERIEEKAVAFGVRDEQLFQQAGELFTDHALVWYRSVRNELRTWSELVCRLRTAFLPADYEYDLWDEIRERTQGPEERVEIFVAVMQNLLNRFAQPVPEPVRLQAILRNLQPKFQSEMSVRQSPTIATLLAVCKNIEDTVHRIASFKNPPTRVTGLLEPELACRRVRPAVQQAETSTKPPLLCWNCRSSEHLSAGCLKPKRLHCFSCGKEGVTKTTCPTCSKSSKNGKA